MLSRQAIPVRNPSPGVSPTFPTCVGHSSKVAIGNRRSLRYGIYRSVLLVVTPMLASPGMAVLHAAETVEVPLLVEKVDGCVSESGLIRLPQEHVQRDPQQIVIEGEEASALSLDDKIFSDPDGLRGVDRDASNGRFICYMNDARYRFKVTTPGKYVVWMRVWAPWAGGWSHTETMDDKGLTLDNDYRLKPELLATLRKQGGGPRSLLDAVMQPNDARLKKWLWIKPTLSPSQQPDVYDLSAGVHELKFDYQGGIRLDKIILARDMNFTPEGKGPPAPGGERIEMRHADHRRRTTKGRQELAGTPRRDRPGRRTRGHVLLDRRRLAVDAVYRSDGHQVASRPRRRPRSHPLPIRVDPVAATGVARLAASGLGVRVGRRTRGSAAHRGVAGKHPRYVRSRDTDGR